MTLVSIVDCDKTLLALELVVDLIPMLDVIAEPLAPLDPLHPANTLRKYNEILWLYFGNLRKLLFAANVDVT